PCLPLPVSSRASLTPLLQELASGVIQGAPADAVLVPKELAAAVGIASPYAANPAVVPLDDMLMPLSLSRARSQLHNDQRAIAGGGLHRLPDVVAVGHGRRGLPHFVPTPSH